MMVTEHSSIHNLRKNTPFRLPAQMAARSSGLQGAGGAFPQLRLHALKGGKVMVLVAKW